MDNTNTDMLQMRNAGTVQAYTHIKGIVHLKDRYAKHVENQISKDSSRSPWRSPANS